MRSQQTEHKEDKSAGGLCGVGRPTSGQDRMRGKLARQEKAPHRTCGHGASPRIPKGPRFLVAPSEALNRPRSLVAPQRH